MMTVKIPDGERYIELTYGTSGDGTIRGSAYFARDDMGAEIVNGEFRHPYSGREYRMHVPGPGSRHNHVSLDVLEWRSVGYGTPTPVS